MAFSARQPDFHCSSAMLAASGTSVSARMSAVIGKATASTAIANGVASPFPMRVMQPASANSRRRVAGKKVNKSKGRSGLDDSVVPGPQG
jgi:hypothetical protein